MPRKTKKQKILTKLRRLEKQSEKPIQDPSVSTEYTSKEDQYSVEELKSEKKEKSVVSETRYDYSHVYKDIRKILLISALALGIEVGLRLTASSGYAKLALRSLNLDF